MLNKVLKKQEQLEHLQSLYEEGLLKTPEGFHEVTNIIKSLLMRYLINSKGGYYKNGVKQSNYDLDDVTNCYIYVMDRVYGTYTYKLGKPGRVKYDPTRMNIASFIHTWTHGYCSDLIKKQQRRYKKNFHKTIYLEDVLEKRKAPVDYTDNFDISDLELELDVHICLDASEVKSIDFCEDDADYNLFKLFLDESISSSLYNKLCNITFVGV